MKTIEKIRFFYWKYGIYIWVAVALILLVGTVIWTSCAELEHSRNQIIGRGE